jgi:hypothetical protein
MIRYPDRGSGPKKVQALLDRRTPPMISMREEIAAPVAKLFDIPWTRLGWLSDNLPEGVRTVLSTLSHSFTRKEHSNPSCSSCASSRPFPCILCRLRTRCLCPVRTPTDDYGRPRSATDTFSGHLQHPAVRLAISFRPTKIQLRARKSKPVQASPTLSHMHFNNFFLCSSRSGPISALACKTRSRRVHEVGRSFPMNLPPNPSVILTHGRV